MAQEADDKTERATPHRRKEAREKGQVCVSREVSSVAALLGLLMVLSLTGGHLLDGLRGIARLYYSSLPTRDVTAAQSLAFAGVGLSQGALLFLPLFTVGFVVGLVAVIAQVGFSITPESLTIRMDKMNPAANISKFFSPNSLVTLLTSLLKLAAIGITCWISIRGELRSIVGLSFGTPRSLVSAIGTYVLIMCLRVTLIMAVVALIDWCWQKYQYEKSLRMSRQEIKDEQKMLEGDPKIKARIRRAQMEMVRKRMMAAVPTADVVVRNPTHYAVALKYDKKSMHAPQVVAKGANYMAKKILKLAARHQIPVITDPPLARAIYRKVKLGHRIPVQLYRAVAKILAQIFRNRRRHAGAAV